jgi:hypothetical protein
MFCLVYLVCVSVSAEQVSLGSINQSINQSNKWAKHLASWYNEHCRNARTAYRAASRANGKVHSSTNAALKSYLQCCKDNRARL